MFCGAVFTFKVLFYHKDIRADGPQNRRGYAYLSFQFYNYVSNIPKAVFKYLQ